MNDARYCRVHPDVRISSYDGQFDGVCGKCETAMSYEDAVSDGAGGTVASGSLDDPSVGDWDPDDEGQLDGVDSEPTSDDHKNKASCQDCDINIDCPGFEFCPYIRGGRIEGGSIEDPTAGHFVLDHADDERRHQQGR